MWLCHLMVAHVDGSTIGDWVTCMYVVVDLL